MTAARQQLWTWPGFLAQSGAQMPAISAAAVTGVDQAPIPGDPERKTRVERTRNGVPLPDDTWAAIVNTAREVGVSEVSIQRVTA